MSETISDAERDELEDLVSRPGRFEGEPPFVPYFWDLAMNGFANYDNGEVFRFIIEAEDIENWVDLDTYDWIELYTDNNGFVYHGLGTGPIPDEE